MTIRPLPEEQRVASLNFELARARLVARAKGIDPGMDDDYLDLLIELETAQAALLMGRMTGELRR